MESFDCTLTSPLSATPGSGDALLALTVAWHPERQRIGEQFVAPAEPATIELSRYLPVFRHPARAGAGLGHASVSRTAVRLVRDAAGGVTVCPPASRMVIELNGRELQGNAYLSRAQVANGAILGLGRTVLLCLHWMQCLPRDNPVPGFLGVGSAAIAAREQIRQAARSDAVVLLLGETGTGKEVTAHAIHTLSRRASASMVCVNMATLNESLAAADLFGAVKGAYTGADGARDGLFAQAQDSTLFLDEIGNTPASVQPMLLRVIESGEYRPLGGRGERRANARLIAATDQDLYGGGFNQALLRRLEQFVIRIPPLRQRREDIGLLLAHMLPATGDVNPPTALISQILNHAWPGNVRELSHTFSRMLLALKMGEIPTMPMPPAAAAESAAPPAGGAAPPAPVARRRRLAELPEEEVLAALQNNGWTIRAVARELGLSRPSVYKLLEMYPRLQRGAHLIRD